LKEVRNYGRYNLRRNAYKIIRKDEGKDRCGRSRHRYKDNIRMYLTEIGWKVVKGYIWLSIEINGGPL
jgi:hypothetical protein